jgi:hypothetical protein
LAGLGFSAKAVVRFRPAFAANEVFAGTAEKQLVLFGLDQKLLA